MYPAFATARSIAVNLSGTPAVTARIPVKGQPNKMTLNAAQTLLYVAEDQSDTVDVIDTTNERDRPKPFPCHRSLFVLPASLDADIQGANPNSVTLSPDETQLYVTEWQSELHRGGGAGRSDSGDQVIGLIPTGWYPNSVSLSAPTASCVYVTWSSGKSPTGANPDWCYGGYGPPGFAQLLPVEPVQSPADQSRLPELPAPYAAQLAHADGAGSL